MSVPDDDVDRLRAWAATKPQIRRLWLFRSRVRGDHSEESDLDIAFDADPGPDISHFNFEVVPQWQAEIATLCPHAPHLQSYGTLGVREGVYQHGVLVYDWTSDGWVHTVIDLIDRKELAAINVGPLFADYLLLFHCAEPWLSRRELASAIAAHAWPPTRGIRAAYLMFDYDGLGSRPIVQLFRVGPIQ